MPIILKTVGLLRRSCFVLPKGKCLDLISVFECLHESSLGYYCSFDEQFGRIILKEENFTVTCFRSGKVMVCGLASDKIVKGFLETVWKGFFSKNVVTL